MLAANPLAAGRLMHDDAAIFTLRLEVGIDLISFAAAAGVLSKSTEKQTT